MMHGKGGRKAPLFLRLFFAFIFNIFLTFCNIMRQAIGADNRMLENIPAGSIPAGRMKNARVANVGQETVL